MQHFNKQPIAPLVSFIIPTYNTPPAMLRACVESVMRLSLSHTEREIIIVDDGSDRPAINHLLDVCDDIMYVRQRNGGSSVARNVGMQLARGKFLQFVDSDDALIQSTYEHCLDLMRYHNPDLVVFDYATKPEASVTEDFEGPFLGADYMAQNNLRGAAWGYLFRRDLTRGIQFSPTLTYAEDEYFTPQIFLAAQRLYRTTAKAYFYRQHGASKVHRRSVRARLEQLAHAEAVIVALQAEAAQATARERKALQRRIAQLTMDHLYNTARHTHSLERLNEACERLRQYGLFPLPKANYTAKYTAFASLVNHTWGRRALISLARL